MKLSAKKMRGGDSSMKVYRCGTKFWRKIACFALCVILLDTNAVGASAAEVSETEAESQSAAGMEDMPSAEEPTPAADEGTDQPKNEEPLDAQITAWSWVDEGEFLTEYDGKWYLSLPGAGEEDLTEDILKEMLPKELRVELADGGTKQLSIAWDFSSLSEASQTYYRLNAEIEDGYVLNEGVEAPCVLVDYGGAEVYADYPGGRTQLSDAELAQALNGDIHKVHGITPVGTTVNLFDYDPQISSGQDNDVLPVGAKFENYSNGINKDALLLFGGSAMREAGFWNLGSGAGRPWGQNNVNMKGIVKSTLAEDGYPYINLDQARSTLQNPTEPIIKGMTLGVLRIANKWTSPT